MWLDRKKYKILKKNIIRKAFLHESLLEWFYIFKNFKRAIYTVKVSIIPRSGRSPVSSPVSGQVSGPVIGLRS